MLINNQQFVKQLYVIVCYILYVNEQSTICKAAICYSVLYIYEKNKTNKKSFFFK